MKPQSLRLLIVLAAISVTVSSAKTNDHITKISGSYDGAYAYSSYPDAPYFGGIPLFYWPELQVSDFMGPQINPAEDCDSGCEIICAAFIMNNLILTIYGKTMS